MSERHLVLAGAGHGHMDLLAALRRGVPAGWRVTLVTPQPDFHYSGMLPGILAGVAPVRAASVPVAQLASAAGITVVEAPVAELDAPARQLRTPTGQVLDFDLLSLDVGSVPSALEVPGAAANALPVRPFGQALSLCDRLDAAAAAVPAGSTVPAVVVGAGAAGVEIACAMRARIGAAGRRPAITLLDPGADGGRPLPGFSAPQRDAAARSLAARHIRVQHARVNAVLPTGVIVAPCAGTAAPQHLESVATAWVTGAAAHPWLAGSGLACDARGFPLAADTLALDTAGTIWGAGDTITLRDHPNTPKAGVYAVRMAPVLAANLLATMGGGAPAGRFVPQRHMLALLSTGDGSALALWRGRALESRWAERLKHWIDTRYLARCIGSR